MKVHFTLLSIGLALSISGFAQQPALPQTNKCVIDTIIKYGPKISPTYKRAVCTEFVIKILEKFYSLDNSDKSRIRIITNESIAGLIGRNSSIPKGVYYALTEKGIGIAIDSLSSVLPGDFVQMWTETWGHCGIVKEINVLTQTMAIYSSDPSTDGYGIQGFGIPEHCYFVRLK